MPKKILILASLAGYILFGNFFTEAFAGGIGEFSLSPLKTCKNPPKSPTNKILYKNYKIYSYFGEWKIYDINGDGLCDWIRGGHQGYRTDNEEPPMRDFIYLGTSKGWRHFDQAKLGKKFKAGINGETEKNVISAEDNALNFYQPIAVYKKGEIKPFIVTVARYDAPAPEPNRNQIEVYQWNGALDKLQLVPKESKIGPIDFLHEQLCKTPPGLMDREAPMIISLGDLCIPRN